MTHLLKKCTRQSQCIFTQKMPGLVPSEVSAQRRIGPARICVAVPERMAGPGQARPDKRTAARERVEEDIA